jgi:hypothetical protein
MTPGRRDVMAIRERYLGLLAELVRDFIQAHI